jgi:hypothetical protein
MSTAEEIKGSSEKLAKPPFHPSQGSTTARFGNANRVFAFLRNNTNSIHKATLTNIALEVS